MSADPVRHDDPGQNVTVDTTTPAAQHVRAEGIGAFLDVLEQHPDIEPHGLIIQRHGVRIVEGYWAPHTSDRSRLVYSLSKSFTGTALGLALGEGLLGLDDLVAEHLPELFGSVDDRTRRMRIRHIASMATGHDREMMLEAAAADPTDPVHGLFTIAPDAEPGSLFAYNQPPVLALATILQRRCGMRLADYLRTRLLEPLGIDAFRWTSTASGVDLGYSGVHTNLDAIARLGQLYLDDGVSDGVRVLPEGWVDAASSVQVPNPQRDEPDWSQGYGFQLWMSRHGYRGDGAFGQYMVVLPEHDAVVAMFSCVETMQLVLDAMWEHLLPAMGDTAIEPSAADDALRERLETLTLPTAAQRLGGQPLVPITSGFTRASGSMSHPTITGVTLDGNRLTVREGETSFDVVVGEPWVVSDGWVAASAARLASGHVVVDLIFLTTPHRLEVELDPDDATFVARWPLVPLFGGGMSRRLASMRPISD